MLRVGFGLSKWLINSSCFYINRWHLDRNTGLCALLGNRERRDIFYYSLQRQRFCWCSQTGPERKDRLSLCLWKAAWPWRLHHAELESLLTRFPHEPLPEAHLCSVGDDFNWWSAWWSLLLDGCVYNSKLFSHSNITWTQLTEWKESFHCQLINCCRISDICI